VLVIPREHVASLDAASDAAQIGKLSLLAAEIARREGVAERGYRTVVNTGGRGADGLPRAPAPARGRHLAGRPAEPARTFACACAPIPDEP
jgi:hypothetical protein